MADIIHLEKVSIVDGSVRANLNLDKYADRFREAQQWLGNRVLTDCKPYMPFVTGSLQQRSYVDKDGREVVFPGPYARYLYMGKVMVDSVTMKGPRKIQTGPDEYVLRFKLGAKLVPTARPLTYTRTYNPQATDHWFDVAKARYEREWVDGVRKEFGGR